MLKSAFECLKKGLNFLKDKEKEVLIIIAIATFLALSIEVIILCLQNQQIQASNKQVHFNRKTELIKFGKYPFGYSLAREVYNDYL